uniref:Exonuclease n=1 Tax=Hirondellea gigas TaxID=1518452 RepID=A0A6A7G460_9CRUS
MIDLTTKRQSPDDVEALETKQQSSVSDLAVEHALLDRKSRQLLKKKRRRIQHGGGSKQDVIDAFGEQASASVMVKVDEYLRKEKTKQLKISDVQQLLFWVLADGVNPKWILLRHKPLIENVVFVMVDSLGHDFLISNTKDLPKLASIFDVACPIMIPSSLFTRMSVLHYYHNCTNRIKGFKPRNNAKRQLPKATSHRPPISHYMLTEQELKQNEYPLSTILETDPNFTQFDLRPAEAEEEGEIAADDIVIDKEEKETTESVDGDEEVEPESKRRKPNETETIHSTTTAKSETVLGSTVEEISTETKKEEISGDCDQKGNLPSLDQLVGMDCEMVVTENGFELARCSIVNDQSTVIFDKFCKPKSPILDYSTRWSGITEETLRNVTTSLEDIQSDLKKLLFKDTIIGGHSLENDLKALKIFHANVIDTALLYPHSAGPPIKSSLKYLTKRFLNRDIQCSESGHDSSEDAIAALELIKLKVKKGTSFGVSISNGESLFSVMNRFRKPCTMIADAAILKRFATSAVSAIICENDSEVVQKSKQAVQGTSAFVWSVLKGPALKKEISAESVRKVDSNISEIYECCRKNTLFIVATGQGMTYQAKSLQEKKMKIIKDGNRDSWSAADQKELDILMSSSQNGLVFVGIK